MRKESDPLYFVFEQHLFTALVEDETIDSFLNRVVTDYLGRLLISGTVVPQTFRETLETDLRDEVLEMLRKKTYGHFSLAAYRKAKVVDAAQLLPAADLNAGDDDFSDNEKTRRSRRAC